VAQVLAFAGISPPRRFLSCWHVYCLDKSDVCIDVKEVSMRNTRIRIVGILFALCSAAGAFAFTLEPMTANLLPSGSTRIATFYVTNDGSSRIALRFRVVTRSAGADGKESNTPAEEDFAVYPARAVVEPGSSAAVKIQWRGAERLERESCYRFIAEEVPIDSAQRTESGLRVMFRYIASVYVGTRDFEPKLEVSVQPSADANGRKGFFVEIANRGTRHVVANNVSIDLVSAGGQSISLSGIALGILNASNYLPGAAYRVFVPGPSPCPDGPFEAALKYESEY
jgi:fimbrial chaperone protein